MDQAITIDQKEYETELTRQERLERARIKYEQMEGAHKRKIFRRLMKIRRNIPHIDFMEGGLIVGVAALADLIDYLIVGSIPVIGDILDIGMWFLIALWVWTRGVRKPPASLFSGIVELIPLGDLLPTWMLMTMIIIVYNNHERKKAERKLRGSLAKIAKAESS